MNAKAEKLLSISQAAEILGVHPLTVRSWADKGYIPFYRTPGGHRRFRANELQVFQLEMGHHQTSALMAAAQEAVQAALAAQQKYMATKLPSPSPWQAEMTDQQRDAMRSVGRNLLGLVIQYVAGNADEAILNRGREIGRTYGTFARQRALSISETVSMFNFFRNTIIEVTFESPANVAEINASNPQLFRRLNHFMDEVLLATIQAVEAETVTSNEAISTKNYS